MGLKVGELFATLGLESGGFDKGLAGAEKSMKSAAKNMSSAGLKLTLGLTTPLVALGKGAFDASMKWESAFTGVKKTIDGTEAEFAALESGIIDMSKELPASAVEIAGVAEAAGQLGVAKGDILGFSKVMIDLGETTNLSADDAATMLAQFANVTQTVAKNGASAYSRLGSVVVALGNDGASTEAQIVSMGQRIAGAGTQLGMTDAQIMGLSSALASVGVEAEAGGSSMSTFLSEMNLAVSNGGKDLKKFAKVAGVSTDEFSKLFKEDAAGALNMFVKGLGAAEDPVKALSDMGINEIRMRDALLRLAGAGDLLSDSFDTANKAWDENAALSDEAAQRYATMESVLALVKNNVTELARQLGDALAPYVMEAAKWVRKLTTFLQGLSPEVKEGAVKIGLLAAAIGPGMLAVSQLMKLMGGGAGFAKVFKLALSPVGLLAGGLFALYKLSPKVRAAFGKMAKSGKTFFKALSNGTSVSDSLGYSVAKVFGGAAYKEYSAVMGKLGRAWSTTVTWLKDTGEGLSKAWNEGSAEGGIFGGIAASAKYIFPRIKSAFESGWETVETAAATLGGKAMAALGTALSGTSFDGLGKKLIEASLALKEGESIDFSGLLLAFENDLSMWVTGVLIPWADSIDWSALWLTFWYRLTDLALWLAGAVLPSAGFILGKLARLGDDIMAGLTSWVTGLFQKGGSGESKTAVEWIDVIFGEGTATALGQIGAKMWEMIAAGFTGEDKGFDEIMANMQRSFDEWLAKVFGQGGEPIPPGKWLPSEWDEFNKNGTIPKWEGVTEEVDVTLIPGDVNGSAPEWKKIVPTDGTETPAVDVEAQYNIIPDDIVFPDAWSMDERLAWAIQNGYAPKPLDIPVDVNVDPTMIVGQAGGVSLFTGAEQPPVMAAPEVKIEPKIEESTKSRFWDMVEREVGTGSVDLSAAMVQGLAENGNSVFTAADGMAAQAFDSLNLDANGKTIGMNFSQGLANGITSGMYAVVSAAQKVALAAAAAARNALKVASPSKVALKIGEFFTEGMAVGIESMGGAVTRASAGVAALASSGLTYKPPRQKRGNTAPSASSALVIDYDRLGGIINNRAVELRVNGERFARATASEVAGAADTREARIIGGYGG